MVEEPIVVTNPQVEMTLATTTKITGVPQRMGMVLSFLEISLCSCGKKDFSWNAIHATNFQWLRAKLNYFLLTLHSLHKESS